MAGVRRRLPIRSSQRGVRKAANKVCLDSGIDLRSRALGTFLRAHALPSKALGPSHPVPGTLIEAAFQALVESLVTELSRP